MMTEMSFLILRCPKRDKVMSFDAKKEDPFTVENRDFNFRLVFISSFLTK